MLCFRRKKCFESKEKEFTRLQEGNVYNILTVTIFVAFVESNTTMSSLGYFENHVSFFFAKPKEVEPVKPISLRKINVSIALKYN